MSLPIPAAVLSAAGNMKVLSDSKATLAGKQGVETSYNVSQGSGLRALSLYSSGGEIVGAKVLLDNGLDATFTISSFRKIEKRPQDFFSFAAPDKSWVVTDLR